MTPESVSAMVERLRIIADRMLEKERDELGAFASALVGTSTIDRIREAAALIERQQARIAELENELEEVSPKTTCARYWMV